MARRVYIDPPNAERCEYSCTLRDGSRAQCGRRHVDGRMCRQHAKMTGREGVAVVVTEAGSWTRYAPTGNHERTTR